MSTHWYVGHVAGGHLVPFQSAVTPTIDTHGNCYGERFVRVTGPFRTWRTAEFFTYHPQMTFNSMAEAERIRRQHA